MHIQPGVWSPDDVSMPMYPLSTARYVLVTQRTLFPSPISTPFARNLAPENGCPTDVSDKQPFLCDPVTERSGTLFIRLDKQRLMSICIIFLIPFIFRDQSPISRNIHRTPQSMCIFIFFRQRTDVAVNGQDIPTNLATGLTTWLHEKFSSIRKDQAFRSGATDAERKILLSGVPEARRQLT